MKVGKRVFSVLVILAMLACIIFTCPLFIKADEEDGDRWELDWHELTGAVGRKTLLYYHYGPDGAPIDDVIWESSNEDVIRPLGGGVFEFVGVGNAVLTCRSEDGKHSDQIDVTVYQGLNYKKYTFLLGIDGPLQLEFRGLGDEVIYGNWNLYDENIVEVSETGLVTPVRYKKDGDLDSRNQMLTSTEELMQISEFVRKKMIYIGEQILHGEIAMNPEKGEINSPCNVCDYKSICRFEPGLGGNQYRISSQMDKQEAKERILQPEERNGKSLLQQEEEAGTEKALLQQEEKEGEKS